MRSSWRIIGGGWARRSSVCRGVSRVGWSGVGKGIESGVEVERWGRRQEAELYVRHRLYEIPQIATNEQVEVGAMINTLCLPLR